MSILDRGGGSTTDEGVEVDEEEVTELRDRLAAAGDAAAALSGVFHEDQFEHGSKAAREIDHRYEEYWRNRFGTAHKRAVVLSEIVEKRTVNVTDALEEDAFFTTVEGHPTLTNRYDLEKAVPIEKKRHFVEVERYWVNKPYAFVVIFRSEKENETKYYLIEPYLTPIEEDLQEFLTERLRTAIKYQSEDILVEEGSDRAAVIERETRTLLDRFGLYDPAKGSGDIGSLPGSVSEIHLGTGVRVPLASIREWIGNASFTGATRRIKSAWDKSDETDSDESKESVEDDSGPTDEEGRGSLLSDRGEGGVLDGDFRKPTLTSPDLSGDGLRDRIGLSGEGGLLDSTQASTNQLGDWLWGSNDTGQRSESDGPLNGISVRPEPAIIEENSDSLSEYQVEKLLYMLKRDFVGYERIDGIKHDINVEDISCDGYNSPVFVYHTDYEQIITNVYHGTDELDEFVVKLAQRSGKGISKRQPQVDATLPDGSRAQLTLGREVSDHGTNYTIRQFKDVPFTPVDLINWRTFSLEQMAFLWLAIENNKSLIFAGGTASGKTTSLNAVSLFIPSNAKIVSIEDTREVELPQRNWIASVTRPSFSDDDKGDIDEFDLLEAALRQRPDYIVMGEVRGEEGRTLFQVMSTGHTTYTTFHADSVGEVLKRFTTEPISVSKTLFTALDLVSVQTETRVHGRKVRRSKSITEINEYNADNDEINVQDIFQWRAEDDEFDDVGRSNVLEEIMFDQGWNPNELRRELKKREVVLAYLIRNGLNEYAQVAATIQAFISDPDTILALMANDQLEESLTDLREMESVEIDIDPEKEELVPRPDPTEKVYEQAGELLERAEHDLFSEYRDVETSINAFRSALATDGGDHGGRES